MRLRASTARAASARRGRRLDPCGARHQTNSRQAGMPPALPARCLRPALDHAKQHEEAGKRQRVPQGPSPHECGGGGLEEQMIASLRHAVCFLSRQSPGFTSEPRFPAQIWPNFLFSSAQVGGIHIALMLVSAVPNPARMRQGSRTRCRMHRARDGCSPTGRSTEATRAHPSAGVKDLPCTKGRTDSSSCCLELNGTAGLRLSSIQTTGAWIATTLPEPYFTVSGCGTES